MEIKLYEEWMQPQVNKLFSLQYGRTEEEVAYTMEKFYNHSFEKEKCIRIVSMDGDKVVGFQSLFFWPYSKNGKLYNSFQSGNSLVHPEYRGRGIFQNLLKYLDDYNKDLNIDFLMGFPVEMSFKSFIKCKWSNPLDLTWHVRFLNPFSFLFHTVKKRNLFQTTEQPLEQAQWPNTFRLNRDEHFKNWIRASRDTKNYFYFTYNEDNKIITFSLKENRRNRWINELVIGDIQTNCNEIKFLNKAFRKLIRKALLSLRYTGISIAINMDAPDNFPQVIKRNLFIPIDKKIYFITKNYTGEYEVENKQSWILYRSDVDTW